MPTDFLENAKPVKNNDDFLAAATPVKGQLPGSPTATIGPAEVPSWLDNLETDLKSGGGRTFIGRGLGTIQGRGDKGYSGLESGVSPATADFMGSPELGAVETAKGLWEKLSHNPLDISKQIHGDVGLLGGILHATEIPSLATGLGSSELGAGAAIDAIPSKAHAGRVFEDLMARHADKPIELMDALQPLERTQELRSVGASSPKPADLLYRRINSVLTPIEQASEPTAPGYTRLYRAESPTVKFHDVFNAEKLNDPLRPPGRSFTPDPEYADYYRQSYGPTARTFYMDVPDSVASASEYGPSEHILDKIGLTYREARDFASELSRPSVMDRLTTKPEMLMEARKAAQGLNADIGRSIGEPDLYADAVKEYARAKRLNQIAKGALGVGAGAGLKAAGAGGILSYIKKSMEK